MLPAPPPCLWPSLALTLGGALAVVLPATATRRSCSRSWRSPTVVGVGLNILVGLTGQVSIGHVGFYAIGAYVVGDPDAEGRELLVGAAGRAASSRASSARCWPCRPCACRGPTWP